MGTDGVGGWEWGGVQMKAEVKVAQCAACGAFL